MHSMQCHVRTHVFVVLYGTFDLFSSETCHKDCIKTILDMVQNTLVSPIQVTLYFETYQIIPIYQRPGRSIENTNFIDVTMTSFFTIPGWNKRILGKIQCVLNKSTLKRDASSVCVVYVISKSQVLSENSAPLNSPPKSMNCI